MYDYGKGGMVLRIIKLAVIAMHLLIFTVALNAMPVEAVSIRDIIERAALKAGAPPRLLVAICTVESTLNPYVVNIDDGGRNSHGLCQLQLRTARWMQCVKAARELYNPHVNARCAAEYLVYQLKRYDFYWPYAIAAYNAGSVRKDKKHRLVNAGYVDKVMRVYRETL